MATSTSTFKFDSKTNEVLDELRRHYGAASKAEVLRKAIALLDVAAKAEDNKEAIFVASETGEPKRQIVIR